MDPAGFGEIRARFWTRACPFPLRSCADGFGSQGILCETVKGFSNFPLWNRNPDTKVSNKCVRKVHAVGAAQDFRPPSKSMRLIVAKTDSSGYDDWSSSWTPYFLLHLSPTLIRDRRSHRSRGIPTILAGNWGKRLIQLHGW